MEDFFTGLFNRHVQWANETFGSRPPEVDLKKLEGELKEAMQDTGDIDEYADIMLCLFSAVHSAGFTHVDLLHAISDKIEKNKKRKWSQNPDKTWSHIKL